MGSQSGTAALPQEGSLSGADKTEQAGLRFSSLPLSGPASVVPAHTAGRRWLPSSSHGGPTTCVVGEEETFLCFPRFFQLV